MTQEQRRAVPFAGSHPAAVLPFVGALPMSALIVGSIAPDLPYYLPLPVTAAQTHSLLGVVAFLVWHLLLVVPLVWLAPEGLQRRIPAHLRGGIASRLTGAGDFWLLCLALVIASLTHVVWDAFTHDGMWGRRSLPGMSAAVLGLTVTRWLHLLSSVAGIAYLTWFTLRWWRQAQEVGTWAPIRPAVRWIPVLALGSWATGSTAHRWGQESWPRGRSNGHLLFIDALVEFLSTLLVGLLAAALLWHLVRTVQPRWDPADAEPS